MQVSAGFQLFAQEAPAEQAAWMEAVQKLSAASHLDQKTKDLAYIAILAAVRLDGGLPFHVKMAKANGATREEVLSSVLLGLPAVGNAVMQSLPVALAAYDQE